MSGTQILAVKDAWKYYISDMSRISASDIVDENSIFNY